LRGAKRHGNLTILYCHCDPEVSGLSRYCGKKQSYIDVNNIIVRSPRPATAGLAMTNKKVIARSELAFSREDEIRGGTKQSYNNINTQHKVLLNTLKSQVIKEMKLLIFNNFNLSIIIFTNNFIFENNFKII
jgi:hypothetical protein